MGRVLVFTGATFAVVVIEAIKSDLALLYEGCPINRLDLVKLVLPWWFKACQILIFGDEKYEV